MSAGERSVNYSKNHVAFAAACLSMLPLNSWGCAACGCSLSADAAMGYSALPGWRLSFEYDYIPQDQLRNGRHAVATVPDGSEFERETLNRYLTLGIDYSPAADWNIGLRMPYVIRSHLTYGEYDSSAPLPPASASRSSSIGDLRLIGAYQGLLANHNLGLQLGIKLPTGQYDTVNFSSGPAAGTPLDASLQPGSGSTDIIIGAYYYRPVGQYFEAFINMQFQSALTTQQNKPQRDFRPGNTTTLSFGMRYEGNPKWAPQLQMNLTHKAVDQGALADVTNTAGDVAYLSPGLTVNVANRLSVYGFAQLPLYSDLVGYQVFPRYTFSVGATYAFQ